LNENSDQETTPKLEGVADPEYEMLLGRRTRLAREPGMGSGERGKRERGIGIVVRNLKMKKINQK
jgi:hypothetical protein